MILQITCYLDCVRMTIIYLRKKGTSCLIIWHPDQTLGYHSTLQCTETFHHFLSFFSKFSVQNEIYQTPKLESKPYHIFEGQEDLRFKETVFHVFYPITVQLTQKTVWFQMVLCALQPLKCVSNEHSHHMCFISEQRLSCLSQTSRRSRSHTDSSQSKVKSTGVGQGGGTVEKSLSANLQRNSASRESQITCREGLEIKSESLQFVMGTSTVSLHTL